MTDRDRLADALALATPEMLREDVATMMSSLAFAGSDETAARLLRLAALALVFATLDEEGDYSTLKAAALLRAK